MVNSPLDPNPGYPFILQVPAFASVRLRAFGPRGERLPSATGFVLNDDNGRPHLITSRSVVTGRESATDQAIAGYAATPAALIADFQQTGEVHGWKPIVVPLSDEHGRPLWREHPELGHKIDVVALPLLVDMASESVDLVAYDRDSQTARLDVASELFVIGFPSTYDPQRAFTMHGIWMRGTIAWPLDLDWNGLPRMLLDCRTREGQIGSPVIYWAAAGTQYIDYRGERTMGPAWSLEGVYGGRIDLDTDIGVVWKKSAIEQVLLEGRVPTAPSDIRVEPDGLRAINEEAANSVRPKNPE